MARSKRALFYSVQPLSPEEAGQPPVLDLAGAASLAGLQQEVPLLRALIRRAVQRERDEEARRQIATLCSALRLERGQTPSADDDLRRLLDDVLDEVNLPTEPLVEVAR